MSHSTLDGNRSRGVRSGWLGRVTKELAEPAVAAVIVGLAGASLALGNLALAGSMSREAFGLISLVQAVAFFSSGFASLGAAQAVPRLVGPTMLPEVIPWRRLMLQVALVATIPVSIVCAFLSGVWYGWPLGTSFAAAILTAGLGLSSLGGNILRARGRALFGQMVVQAWRLVAFPALGLVAVGVPGAVSTTSILALFAGVGLLAGAASVGAVWQTSRVGPVPSRVWKALWGDSRHFLGIAVSLAGLNYLDRLMIPQLLGLEELALYAVLWWVIGMPFTLAQAGIGFTLMPRLRMLSSRSEARAVLVAQAGAIGTLIVVGGTAMVFAAPPLVNAIYAGRYDAPPTLALTLVLIGALRLIYVLPSSIVGAWADTRTLARFHWSGWPSLLVAVFGVWVGGVLAGMVGVALGTACGFAARVLAASFFAYRSWRGLAA